jgi:hypothetical protein
MSSSSSRSKCKSSENHHKAENKERRYTFPKGRVAFNGLLGVISQKIKLFIGDDNFMFETVHVTDDDCEGVNRKFKECFYSAPLNA